MPDPVIGQRSTAGLEFSLIWDSPRGHHQDDLFAYVNLYQDDLPLELARGLIGAGAGRRLEFPPALRFGPRDPGMRRVLARADWPLADAPPRQGRFYPRRAFPGLGAGGGPVARLVAADETSLTLDLNHPLAGREVALAVTVREPEVSVRLAAPGPVDWLARLGLGPGMQIPAPEGATDFYADQPFRRQAESPDPEFYRQARMVPHLDAAARTRLEALHARLLRPGTRVLDLMASLYSHLPPDLKLAEVIGIGLNQAELEANPALTRSLVHDLNAEPRPPLEPASLDAIICTSSLEYLTQPQEVLAGCLDALKPGGLLLMSFSNRYFPPKVVRIWSELHEFERLGLALDYYRRAGGLTDIQTWSDRGWPRPADDLHYPEQQQSDPLFAIWGRKS
ncbi:MAG: methyltransferase domain-containing protein [Desulfarculus sp.]|nr:methyltransferase domain-containing protein [Desulfarculus sp.]